MQRIWHVTSSLTSWIMDEENVIHEEGRKRKYGVVFFLVFFQTTHSSSMGNYLIQGVWCRFDNQAAMADAVVRVCVCKKIYMSNSEEPFPPQFGSPPFGFEVPRGPGEISPLPFLVCTWTMENRWRWVKWEGEMGRLIWKVDMRPLYHCGFTRQGTAYQKTPGTQQVQIENTHQEYRITELKELPSQKSPLPQKEQWILIVVGSQHQTQTKSRFEYICGLAVFLSLIQQNW